MNETMFFKANKRAVQNQFDTSKLKILWKKGWFRVVSVGGIWAQPQNVLIGKHFAKNYWTSESDVQILFIV